MKKSYEVLFNLLFWILVIYLTFYWIESQGISFDNDIHIQIINLDISGHGYFQLLVFFDLIGPFINFYLFYLLFVPKLLVRKKIMLFVLFSLLSSFILGYTFRLTFGGNVSEIQRIFVFTVMALIPGIIGGGLKGFFLWRKSISEKVALEKKHLEGKTALLLLKAQLNPHFLFNSLNNIDILIEETPKIASEYLKKLSDILRYVLYDTKEDETELGKEIDQIRSYVELQKIRTDNPYFVQFKITGELQKQKIAPMIFLPFVENAFKHCNNKSIENAIVIEFELSANSIKMVCRNYYEPKQLEVLKNEGLGIETIKQRLNLLYPEHHKLFIDQEERWFNVILSIKLKDDN